VTEDTLKIFNCVILSYPGGERAGATRVPNTAVLHSPPITTPLQATMSTEESAIFEKEKGRLLDEITKVSPRCRPCPQKRSHSTLQGLEEVISLANSINRAHEESVSIGKTLLAESSMWNPMHRIILETAKGDASMQSIIEDRGMPGTGGVRYGRASENDGC